MARAVAEAQGVGVAGRAAADVGVLDRVDVDGEAEGVHRPRAGTGAARARRGDRLAAGERAGAVAVARAAADRAVEVGKAHVADPEVQRVEPAEDARQGPRRARGD